MPVIGQFHSFYWNLSDTAAPPVKKSRGGYPAWQSGIVSGVVFGPPLEMVKPWWARVQWAWRLWRQLWRVPAEERASLERWLTRLTDADQEQRAVYERVAGMLTGPAWPDARIAVRATATTLGFNRPEAWIGLSRVMKDSPGRAENTFRHLHAVAGVRERLKARSSTLSNPDADLLIQLGYDGFSQIGS